MEVINNIIMTETSPSEFHVTFMLKNNSLECISSPPSAFTNEEKILFINRIPLVKTKHGKYELYKDIGEVVNETPGRYIYYQLLK